MKYKAEFTGRTKNAQGIMQSFVCEVEGENKEDARLRLYDNYEHIFQLKLTPIDDFPTPNMNTVKQALKDMEEGRYQTIDEILEELK